MGNACPPPMPGLGTGGLQRPGTCLGTQSQGPGALCCLLDWLPCEPCPTPRLAGGGGRYPWGCVAKEGAPGWQCQAGHRGNDVSAPQGLAQTCSCLGTELLVASGCQDQCCVLPWAAAGLGDCTQHPRRVCRQCPYTGLPPPACWVQCGLRLALGLAKPHYPGPDPRLCCKGRATIAAPRAACC